MYVFLVRKGGDAVILEIPTLIFTLFILNNL